MLHQAAGRRSRPALASGWLRCDRSRDGYGLVSLLPAYQDVQKIAGCKGDTEAGYRAFGRASDDRTHSPSASPVLPHGIGCSATDGRGLRETLHADYGAAHRHDLLHVRLLIACPAYPHVPASANSQSGAAEEDLSLAH